MNKVRSIVFERAQPIPKKERLVSGGGNGLYLRIRQNGTKTWILDYELKGARAKPTLGVFDPQGAPGQSISDWLRHGRLSLAQAQAIAGNWKDARRAGHDPYAEWLDMLSRERDVAAATEAARVAEDQRPTLRKVIDIFMAKHMEGKRSAPAIRYRLDQLGNILGDKKMAAITRQDVIAAIDSIAEGKKLDREGNRRPAKQLSGEVLIQAKRVWRFAEVREWVSTSCIERLTRKDFDARPVKRETTLRMDEVADLWLVLGDRSKCKADPVTVGAIKLVMLTGQREREVTDAEWNEFDLDRGLWKIPAHRTKKERAHLVHLSPVAIEVLSDLKKLTGTRRHVFSSPLKPEQPIYGRSTSYALSKLFDRGVMGNVTRCHIHDLRRTLISRLPDLGYEPFIGHKIANHVLPGVMAHYNHAEYLEQRKNALHAWAERIVTLATQPNVVQLQRAAA